jgi:hypothetical protein
MNPHLKRLDDLEEARKLWAESEWRLDFLRSIPAAPNPDPDNEEILQWFYQLKRPTPIWS